VDRCEAIDALHPTTQRKNQQVIDPPVVEPMPIIV